MARRRDDVTIEIRSDRGGATLDVFVGGRRSGVMELTASRGVLAVSYAEVLRPGQGVGTRLYEAAAQFACGRGRQLSSDTKRSRFSEGFWAKQAKKGRATCDARAGGIRLRDDLTYAGKWRCRRYLLSCPAPSSLAGVRR